MTTHFLYRFFDDAESLLYVGITGSLEYRIGTHRSKKPWWDLVATLTVERFPSRREAEVAERIAIRDEAPVFNIARPDPQLLARDDVRLLVANCSVCGHPLVDELWDGSEEQEEHERCNEAVVNAYEAGIRAGMERRRG